MQSYAQIETERASQYLAALCHHFGRRLPVEFAPAAGRIRFSVGQCDLSTDDRHLFLAVTADDRAALDTLTKVVADHLERFAFREQPAIVWRPDKAAA